MKFLQIPGLNPYCTVQIVPKVSNKATKAVHTGKVQRNTWSPSFDEQFALTVERSELETRSLLISVYHDDCATPSNTQADSALCVGKLQLYIT